MAQIREVQLVDDIDGEAADETVEFGIDGKSYEIDLSKEHRAELDAIMAEFQDRLKKFTDVARPAGRAASTGRTPARRSSGSGVDASTVRLWAVENGFDVKDRGRIPVEVMDAYRNRGKKG